MIFQGNRHHTLTKGRSLSGPFRLRPTAFQDPHSGAAFLVSPAA